MTATSFRVWDIDNRLVKKGWKLVSLGDLLEKSPEPVEIDPVKTYKEVKVRLWGQGVSLRGEKTGSEIGATKRFIVHKGQFIFSRIDARNGAFGIIPEELDGAVVSNDFPVHNTNEDILTSSYLGWLSRVPLFVDACRAVSEGTTNRVRLKEEKFYRIEIPLPPLSEQRRIVAKIERLAGKVEDAKGLRTSLHDATDSFFVSIRAEQIRECLSKGEIPITEAILFERGKFSHRPRNDPRFFNGDHPWIQIGEIEASNKYITSWNTTLNDEGLAISRKFPKETVLISIAATIGAVGILGFDCCIPDSIVAATPKPGIESEFVYHYLGFLRTHLEEVAPQSAQKNINLKILSALPFPSISQSEQVEVVRYLDRLQTKIDNLKTQQTKTAAALDAMFPSILDRAFKGGL
jgi:type I restriction enzyme S subunit